MARQKRAFELWAKMFWHGLAAALKVGKPSASCAEPSEHVYACRLGYLCALPIRRVIYAVGRGGQSDEFFFSQVTHSDLKRHRCRISKHACWHAAPSWSPW
ncbi:hypothetical protein BZA70DRAFT_266743 [Myxozyma melibiosi]|uniref:Secreted protein n=1 Tax=Myxozyma melibiosi TaxID=54550 RepID=A0ABR1F9B8_9ASCO